METVETLQSRIDSLETKNRMLAEMLETEKTRLKKMSNYYLLDKLASIKVSGFLLKYVEAEGNTHRNKAYHVKRALECLADEYIKTIDSNQVAVDDMPF